MTRVGLIADTHNLLRPEALTFLRGSDLILHAGDICGPQVLESLARIAPVTAVRGNNDTGAWAEALACDATVQVEDVTLLMLHDLQQLGRAPRGPALPPGVQVVVSGHSHKPAITQRDDVLFVNPGSAGPRRFSLPVSVGELLIEGRRVTPRLHTLALQAAPAAPSVKRSR